MLLLWNVDFKIYISFQCKCIFEKENGLTSRKMPNIRYLCTNTISRASQDIEDAHNQFITQKKKKTSDQWNRLHQTSTSTSNNGNPRVPREVLRQQHLQEKPMSLDPTTEATSWVFTRRDGWANSRQCLQQGNVSWITAIASQLGSTNEGCT